MTILTLQKNTSMLRVFKKINFILLILSNIAWSQPLKIKWQEIYGQLNKDINPIEFIQLNNNDFYLLTDSDFDNGIIEDSLFFRTNCENIIDINTREIKYKTNRSSFSLNSPGKTIFTKNGLIFQSSGPLSSASTITVYKPGVENWINAVNIGIEANGNHKPSRFSDLLEEESGNISCIGYDDKPNEITYGEYDILYAKLSPEGNLISSSRFGGDKDEIIFSFTKVSEFEYIGVGKKEMLDGYSASNFNLYIVKINVKTNQIIWEKTYGGTREDLAKKILPIGDGTFYIVGTSKSEDGDVVGYHSYYGRTDPDAWILRIDSMGNIIWKKTIGGLFEDMPNDAILYENNSLLFAGNAYVNGNELAFENSATSKSWLLNLDIDGTIIWQNFFSGNHSYGGSIKKIIKAANNKIYFAGVPSIEGDFSSLIGQFWNSTGFYIFIGELEKENASPSIFIPSLLEGRICSDSIMNFSFTSNDVFLPNNQFKIQLSDSKGSFLKPFLLKTVNQPGNYNLTVPDSLVKSAYYRIRVVSTSPIVESYVTRRIELINSYSKATLTPIYESMYPVSKYVTSGQTIPFSVYYEGFGPYNIKLSNGSIYSDIISQEGTITEKIYNTDTFKITELRNPCGVSQHIYGDFEIKEALNICIPQFSNDSYIKSIKISRNNEKIIEKFNWYYYGINYLNYCSENINNNLQIGDTLNFDFKVSANTHYKAWFDKNRNNIFEPNEVIFSSDTNSVLNLENSYSYLFPQNIPGGEYRIRINTNFGKINNPCSEGNASDFCINIIPNPPPKIIGISLPGYNSYVCENGTLNVSLQTSGIFEPDNEFKVFITDYYGAYRDSILIGKSNSNSIACTLPFLQKNISSNVYKIRVESSHPKIFKEYENTINYNYIARKELGDEVVFIDKGNPFYSIYFENQGTIPISYTTNFGYSGVNESLYNRAIIPISNTDTLRFTQVSNACGSTQPSGKVVFKKYDWNAIEIGIIDKSGSKKVFPNYKTDQGQFNVSELMDSINIYFKLPQNVKSYQVNSFGVLEIRKSENVTIQEFLVSNQFLPKKMGLYILKIRFYGDFENKSYIGEREISFEIVESKSPCLVYNRGCSINPNYFINDFKVFDRFDSNILNFESTGCNAPGSYYGGPNIIYRFDKTPPLETTRKYSFKVTSGENNTYQHFYIYIDYNKSGDFSPNELLYSTTANLLLKDSLVGNFVLPSNIISGKYYMRTFTGTSNANGDFLLNYSPCNQYYVSNEINDYYIEIKNPLCPDIVTVLENYQNFILLEVNSSAILKNKILENSNVIIDSGRNIILEPGFETKNNVVFSTLIEGCGNN